MSLNFTTWNMQSHTTITGPLDLAKETNADILALQEIPTNIANSSNPTHAMFNDLAHTQGYTPIFSEHTITLIKQSTLGTHHLTDLSQDTNGRVQTHVFITDTDSYMAVINIYGWQQQHPNYTNNTTKIIEHLNTTVEKLNNTYNTPQLVVLGDLNVDLREHAHNKSPNILEFFQAPPKSLFPATTLHHHDIPSTHQAGAHHDYCLTSPSLTHDIESSTIMEHFTTTISPSDHFPVSTKIKYDLQQTKNKIKYNDLNKLPNYAKLSHIPVRLQHGAHPESTNRNPKAWYTADKTKLPLPSQHEDAQNLLNAAITAHTSHNMIQTHHEQMNKSISTLQNIINTQLRQHTRSNSHQTFHPTRTPEIQTHITNAYRAFEAGIDLTFDTMDLLQKPKSQKYHNTQNKSSKPTPHNKNTNQQHLSMDRAQERLRASYKSILDNHKRNPQSMQHLQPLIAIYARHAQHLHTETSTYLTTATIDLDSILQTATETHQQRLDKQADKRNRKRTNQRGADTPTTPKPLPPPPVHRTTEKPDHHPHYLKHTIDSHLKTAKTLKSLSTSIKTITTTHLSPPAHLNSHKLTTTLRILKAKQIQYRKHLITLGQTKNTPISSYHTAFGQPKLAAQLTIPTPKTQTNANTHYLKPTAPHLSPLKIPASGPRQRIEATHSTQQAQMDLPPGKAIHYVDLTTDQVGANGITVDLTKPFTEQDLRS